MILWGMIFLLQTIILQGCQAPLKGINKDKIDKIRKTYGINIHYRYDRKKCFPQSWLRPPISAKGSQISSKEAERLLTIIEEFLSKYPKRVLLINLSDIYLLGKLEFYSKSYVATANKSGLALYIKSGEESKGFSELFLQGTMHSQFSSILLSNYSYLFPTEAWEAANASGWQYIGTQEEILGGKAYKQSEELLSRGFLVKYSQSSLENDFRMFANWIFTRPKQVQELASSHSRINEKYKLVKQFYDNINNIDTSSGAWEQKKLELESKYGLGIVFDNVEFPEYWERFQRNWTPIPSDLRLSALNALEVDLAKYKPDFLKKHLNSIYLCRHLEFKGQTYGGTTDYTKKWLYLTALRLGDNGLHVHASGFHSEFSSILLNLYKSRFPIKLWKEFNLPTFKYIFEESSWRNLTTGKTKLIGNPRLYSQGFICDYGQVTFEDDVNTYAQYLIAKPKKLDQLTAKYPLIKQKAELLKEFYKAIGFKQ